VDEDVAWVVDSELRLLRPEVRRSPAEVERLLDPEFFEFGSSGRRWDRAATVAAMGGELTEDDAPGVTDVHGVRLADGVVQVTYVSQRPGRRVLRSSLWRKGDGGAWRIYFHQGTVAQ
jgi:hypothetical protein